MKKDENKPKQSKNLGMVLFKKVNDSIIPRLPNKKVMVKVVNISKKTGKAQFNFTHSNLKEIDTVICAICQENELTNHWYVFATAGGIPKELSVRPGVSKKWAEKYFSGTLDELVSKLSV